MVPLPIDPEVKVNLGSPFFKVNIYCLEYKTEKSLIIGCVLFD